MAAGNPEIVITLTSLEIFMKFQRLNPCFRGHRIHWRYNRYSLMTVSTRKWKLAFFQTGSSYNYAAGRVICEIPTLKPMFSRSLNLMVILLIMIDNGKYPEMETGLFQTGSSYNFGPITDRDVVSSATTMFSGVAVTMQHQLRCRFVDIFEKFKMAANEFYLAGAISVAISNFSWI